MFHTVFWAIVVLISIAKCSEVKPTNLISLKNISQQIPLSALKKYANLSCPLSLGMKQYTEMSCKMTEKRNATFLYCPKAYDCSKMLEIDLFHTEKNYVRYPLDEGTAEARPEDSCMFRGKTYQVNDVIPSKMMNVRCKENCVCKLDDYGIAGFVCDTIVCPTPKPGCRLIYKDHLQCCPSVKCSERLKKEPVCKFRGKKFSHGELLIANHMTTRCLCQKGYDGTLTGKWCQGSNCGIELVFQANVKQGCSPVYLFNTTGVNDVFADFHIGGIRTELPPPEALLKMQEALSERFLEACPSYWICPSDDDITMPAASLMNDLPDLDPTTTCTFGYNDLAMADVIMTPELADSSCTMCMCLLPPMLSCFQKTPCWGF